AACTTPNTTPTPSVYAPPWFLHFTTYWIPTPALDLMSPDATFIRAVNDSTYIAMESGSQGARAAYPGFLHASEFHHPPPHIGGGTDDPTQPLPPSNGALFIGAFHSDGNIATATICVPGPAWTGEVLTYRRTGTPPPANQHGPHWYPIHNVFGDWQVLNDIGTDFNQPPSLAVRQCAAAHIPEPVSPPNSPGWSWNPNPGA
ncbi:hypothetical protein ACLQ3C_21455, partial [Gordonia sp. DT30]|uniref:hypothetical protein n=1 Tax=unclassified Gordonia (in: high G+C Gram-positive bacteria) TaxID=2657482 RepID=UPI003CF69FA5